ncbi:ankyrin repeat domain-containing protein [Sphingopyxis sp. PAMC25046]|uniref:ankyrin repeat domain-containing protein n=1 Tax=Sphingopyxis sp. PAMC25046 TaxID=2565556 RepID=UPI00109DBD5F|nr:ankyrin repeat domain-containing protein [Sphingopyxis sp. PAMC25046]QCB56590.1 ankyrin repeat domain-containing protein [Sphingopyxis sp. PAMC25046]
MFRRAEFRLASCLLLLLAVAGLALPAQAQFRGGYAFLQAVENRDGTKATEALKDDPSFVNTRNPDTGETALIIVAKRRDISWLRFLLAKGADPSIGDRQEVTPLMHTALINFTDGAEELLDRKAPVDQANRRGETALILAVQARNVAMVRLLVKRGANPDKTDHIAGMSARDYAKRNDRSGRILALLEAKADTPEREFGPTFGPQ